MFYKRRLGSPTVFRQKKAFIRDCEVYATTGIPDPTNPARHIPQPLQRSPGNQTAPNFYIIRLAYYCYKVLEMDVCDLDLDAMKAVLLNQPLLHTFRCTTWLHTSALNMANLQLSFRLCLDLPQPFITNYFPKQKL